MSSPRLTRRGRAVAAICLVGVGMALAAGGRSLEPVVLPGVVALAAGYVQIARIDDPVVERTLPDEGFVGESREVRLAFRGSGPSGEVSPTYVADVADALDDGLTGPTDPVRTSVGDDPATYRVSYLRRGERRFGPVTVTAGDVFGLFERRMVVDESGAVLAYPPCRRIPAWFRRALYADDAVGASRQREEFDRLREYTRGDRPRDVHWPATAKHDELVVKAFAAETERGRVSIAGEATGGREGADALASATASLALALLDDGVPVDVRLPSGIVSADPGRRGRRAVLELAARTGPGAAGAEESDVRVVADGRGARYQVDDRTIPFEGVAGARVAGTRVAEEGGDGARGDGTDGDRAIDGGGSDRTTPELSRRGTETRDDGTAITGAPSSNPGEVVGR